MDSRCGHLVVSLGLTFCAHTSGTFFSHLHLIFILDTPALSGMGRKKWAHAWLRSLVPKPAPFGGSVLHGNAQNPSGFPGKVFLDEDSGRYFLLSTSLTLVQMVHSEVVGLQTGTASEGTNFNTCRYRSPIENCFSLAGSGQVGLHRRQAEAILSLQAHALSGVGFLTLAF